MGIKAKKHFKGKKCFGEDTDSLVLSLPYRALFMVIFKNSSKLKNIANLYCYRGVEQGAGWGGGEGSQDFFSLSDIANLCSIFLRHDFLSACSYLEQQNNILGLPLVNTHTHTQTCA